MNLGNNLEMSYDICPLLYNVDDKSLVRDFR